MESETMVRVAEIQIDDEKYSGSTFKFRNATNRLNCTMNLKEIFTYNSESSELLLSEDDKRFLEKIAKKIHQHGMVTPAVFFLEMTKPLALLGLSLIHI